MEKINIVETLSTRLYGEESAKDFHGFKKSNGYILACTKDGITILDGGLVSFEGNSLSGINQNLMKYTPIIKLVKGGSRLTPASLNVIKGLFIEQD